MRRSLLRLTIREKVVLLSLVILIVVSFGLTLVHLQSGRALVEEDMADRAVGFAREIAATIGDRGELESGPRLDRQMQEVAAVRPNVKRVDVLAFTGADSRLVATSQTGTRLPFTRREAGEVRRGRVVSRLVQEPGTRFWEVIAPVTFDGAVAGAVAVQFSLDRADAVATTTRRRALLLTGVSVIVMGVLMSVTVQWVVIRPLGRVLAAVRRVERGDTTATVDLATGDEFAELARHFNTMMAQLRDFSDELQRRVKEATAELEGRYREVERLNETLFTVQRRLGHAERLGLAGRIMAEVAHEIGTPLHSVAGHVELLRRDLPAASTPEGARRRLELIDSQLARVNQMIAQLLDLTRPQLGVPARLDLGRLVRDTAEVVRPGLSQQQIALEVTAAPALPPVLGHAHQLQQVVLNLLTNALDATPPGGRVVVTTRRRDAYVEVEVRDSGPGVPEARRRRIFEPFFSTKEAGRGTGLGLFVSLQIVREHTGKIEVADAEGGGAAFRLLLPAAAPEG